MIRKRSAPLLAALLLSLVAHAITLSGGWLHLPQDTDKADPPPLRARLQPAPAAVPAAPQLAPKKRVATAKPNAIATAPATVKTDAPAPWVPPVTEADTTEAAAAPETPVLAAPAPAPAPAPEPVVVATAAPTTYTPEPAAIKTLPRRGRIDYKFLIYFNNFLTDVARTTQSWEADATSYKLNSKSVPFGLARLAPIGAHEYQSAGQITERGLVPQRYTSREIRRGVTNEAGAQFDWDKNQLQFGRAAEQKNAALPAGSQDFVSFMFQLSLAPPPPGRLSMPITNGRNFETYELDVLPEETLDTPMGPLRVLPIKRASRADVDGITVYLATEYRYLPVRVLHFNRDGTPGGEIIVTSIQVE